MTWRYRVGTKNGFTGIIEYYEWEDDDGEKKVSFTYDFVSPIGVSELELIQDIRMMLRAFDEPVVDVEAEA